MPKVSQAIKFSFFYFSSYNFPWEGWECVFVKFLCMFWNDIANDSWKAPPLTGPRIFLLKNLSDSRSHIIHIPHTRRARHLPVFEQFSVVQRLSIARPFGHSSRRTCHRLCQRCTKGKDVRATIANPSIAQPSRTDHKGAKLSKSMCSIHSQMSKYLQNALLIQFQHFCFSTERSVSAKPARARTNESCGGHWPRPLSWSAWDSGKCGISKRSSRQRNWSKFLVVGSLNYTGDFYFDGWFSCL